MNLGTLHIDLFLKKSKLVPYTFYLLMRRWQNNHIHNLHRIMIQAPLLPLSSSIILFQQLPPPLVEGAVGKGGIKPIFPPPRSISEQLGAIPVPPISDAERLLESQEESRLLEMPQPLPVSAPFAFLEIVTVELFQSRPAEAEELCMILAAGTLHALGPNQCQWLAPPSWASLKDILFAKRKKSADESDGGAGLRSKGLALAVKDEDEDEIMKQALDDLPSPIINKVPELLNILWEPVVLRLGISSSQNDDGQVLERRMQQAVRLVFESVDVCFSYTLQN